MSGKILRLAVLLGLLCFAPGLRAEEPAGDKTKSDLFGNFALSDDKGQPMYIRSDSLFLDAKERIFTYKGNVELTRGEVKITSDALTGEYDEKRQLKRMQCDNNVVITRGDTMRATSNRAVYDVPTGKIVLTEGPELMDRGNALSADRVIVYVNEDRSEAEGNVRVKVLNADQPKS